MADPSNPPPSSRALSLSPHQRRVLDCLEQGLGEHAVCEQTGLDPRSVALAIGDLRALRLVDKSLRPSLAPAPRSAPFHAAPPTPRLAIQIPDTLPVGVEPWQGDEMPQGSTAPEAPDSDSLIPTPRVSQAPGSTAYPTVEPTRPRSSTIPPTSRALPAEALNYRKLYEHKFRDCSVDDRIALASQAVEADLLALCLDSSTRVIHALLQNPHFGLDHARTVAAHHGTPQGLEQLARHAQFLRDAHVARRLLQNPQLPDAVLLRSLAGRQLLGIYRAGVDRDLPERNRTRVRAQLRIHFSRAEPNERASLIIKTEGRCLGQLAGSTFDGKTTALLCHHNYASTLLIQNLARFSATPPAVLQKLLRCGPVRRQAQLRTLVQRHPNCSNSSGDP